MKKVLIIMLCLLVAQYAQAGTWTELNYPEASKTYIRGVSGNNLVGYYEDAAGNRHGFRYNGTNWATLDKLGAGATLIYGIDGSNIVGYYGDASGWHGFQNNGATWTTPDVPGAILGISGNNLVGNYSIDFGNSQGFLYNVITQSYTFLNAPGGLYQTSAMGIDGSNIVGFYEEAHGFLYDGTTWTVLDMPGANWTYIHGIDGSNIVGQYLDEHRGGHGFLYNGTSWLTLDMPGATLTRIWDIDGNKLVGDYEDATGYHGFVYEIPEPATLLLLGFGIILARKKLVQ